MMKKVLLFTVVIFLSLAFQAPDKKVRIFIAGDSTAQTYKEKDGLIRGWGQMLHKFLTDDVKVVNHAMGGRSSKTFIEEGRWDRLLSEVQSGDYVIIQFGHNDASTRPERHASHKDYYKNLTKFVNDVRSKNANPILATSIVMRTFKDRVLVDDRLKAYPAITRMAARDLSVPLIDANVASRDLVLLLGDEPSKPYYRWVEPGIDPVKPDGIEDDTHMLELGATQMASFIAEEISRQDLENLSEYVIADQFLKFNIGFEK